jgi:exonuclease VII small subunit
MTNKSTQSPIKASFAFTQLAPADLYQFGCAIYAGVNNNPAYPQPPVEMPALKSTLDGYNTLVAAALDGSKQVLSERNRQGEVLKKILTQLAHYVESASKDDMTTFTSSGFQAVSKVRATTPSLSESIRKIAQGSSSGVLLVSLVAVAGALSYEIRCGAVPAGTTAPATPAWTIIIVPSVRPPATISNLTPGTNYQFEVRVYTKSGWSDWGGSATRMVI